jgi:uncharacterized protein (DUF2384 family)
VSVRAPASGLLKSADSMPLVTTVMGTGGRLDIDRITEVFNMTKGQLAETAGLARDTLQKTPRRDAPKTQARVTEMLEILSRVEAWAGGRPQAMAWYRAQPIPALDGRTAEALVKSGQATLVRDYLDQIAVGGFA